MTTLEEDVNRIFYAIYPELDTEKIEFEKRKEKLMYKIRKKRRRRELKKEMKDWLKGMAFSWFVVVPITLLVLW